LSQRELHSAFISLVQQHERIIYKMCYLYADNADDRKDLYQDIVVQVWKAYPNFRGDAKFSTWLYQIAINTALSYISRNKRSIVSFIPGETLPEVADTGINTEHDEQLALLHKSIACLNEIEKAIVVLYIDNKSYEEMESIMGINNGALRTKMNRIKEKLKKITKTNGYGTE
jgi:RNA polymerase sigma-70 factor (ECF subfamily)